MVWDYTKRNGKAIIKWAVGVIAFTAFADYYEESKGVLWRTVSGMTFPFGQTEIFGLIGLAAVIVGLVLIGSDVASRVKSYRKQHGKVSITVVDSEAYMKRQDERMRQVYGPLYSAVVSMREGRSTVPEGYTVGTPFNAWSKYPEIMQRIIDIFSNYPNLVENEKVWKGWTQKEHELREGKFWFGKEVYEWFDAIEEEYNRIDLELRPEPVTRNYDIATLTFKISSTTNWFEIGLLNSRHVTIGSYELGKGSIKPVDDPNSSHLRIDLPATEVSVTATFEVYSGPLFVFTRKGDYGTLKGHVLNKHGEKIWEIPEYAKTDGKYKHNYQEQPGFDFNDWD